jgi:hypothetical protein
VTACGIDRLLRDFIAGVLRVMQHPHRPDLIPAIDAECRAAAYRIRESMSADDFERLQQHVLLALQINGRIDHGVKLAFFWFAGKAIEHDFDSAKVARRAPSRCAAREGAAWTGLRASCAPTALGSSRYPPPSLPRAGRQSTAAGNRTGRARLCPGPSSHLVRAVGVHRPALQGTQGLREPAVPLDIFQTFGFSGWFPLVRCSDRYAERWMIRGR